jgi:hypothetical protein
MCRVKADFLLRIDKNAAVLNVWDAYPASNNGATEVFLRFKLGQADGDLGGNAFAARRRHIDSPYGFGDEKLAVRAHR